MAMNIKNERVHELAREAARRTGSTQTSAPEAAPGAVPVRLREQDAHSGPQAKLVRARALVDQIHASMADEDRAAMRADLEMMYDEEGLPA
ncbi:type II toxin-antitoxin system VapB family antitoxin [Janibacter limosus]|uniref:Type II toxin-antitoxin system VapB family antitoxin n=1 Tax=Janibacter limosus TaxID=53458 RepID=A0AC61U886_9MICO|nr:type II toxin-antitoxin system VapB family antitoxin [Janibacter limosus]UUZ45981.1 type II toxin-antitoxin system VapB family antitoxin [Janibacter limosus]